MTSTLIIWGCLTVVSIYLVYRLARILRHYTLLILGTGSMFLLVAGILYLYCRLTNVTSERPYEVADVLGRIGFVFGVLGIGCLRASFGFGPFGRGQGDQNGEANSKSNACSGPDVPPRRDDRR